MIKINTELKRSNSFVSIQDHEKKFVNINIFVYDRVITVHCKNIIANK